MIALLTSLPVPILLLLILTMSIILTLLLLIIALHPDAGKRISNVIIALGHLRDRQYSCCDQCIHSKRGTRRVRR